GEGDPATKLTAVFVRRPDRYDELENLANVVSLAEVVGAMGCGDDPTDACPSEFGGIDLDLIDRGTRKSIDVVTNDGLGTEPADLSEHTLEVRPLAPSLPS